MKESLGLTETDFGQLVVSEPDEKDDPRNTVTKWWAKTKREPRFTSTRRIVTIAPVALLRQFIGPRAEQALVSDLASTSERPQSGAEATTEMNDDAQYIAKKIDAIQDEKERNRAVRGCLAAIEAAKEPDPQKPGGETSSDLARP